MIVNIETFSDSDFNRTFIYKTGGDTPVPISLEGATMRMMVRKRASAASAMVELSTDNQRIVIDYDVPGKFSILIPFSELSILSEDIYVHSLIITWTTTGLKEPVWRGTMTHKIGPTR